MPNRITVTWEPAEVMLTHKGVTIYFVYANDEADDAMAWWYSFDPNNSRKDQPPTQFNVTELPTWKEFEAQGRSTSVFGKLLALTKQALINAIDQGIIKPKTEGKLC